MLIEKLNEIYKGIGWEMAQVPNETIISITYAEHDDQWVVVASSDEKNKMVVLFSRLPFACPVEKFNEMSLFIEKVNFGMSLGAWVMDRNDGEVRFKVGIDFGKIEMSPEYIKDLTLYINLTMKLHLNGMKAIVHDNKSASEAHAIVFPE